MSLTEPVHRDTMSASGKFEPGAHLNRRAFMEPNHTLASNLKSCHCLELLARMKDEGMKSILSERERQVTTLVADGLSNKEVAYRLGVTEGTVKIHLNRIFDKTGTSNRTKLARLVLERDAAVEFKANQR